MKFLIIVTLNEKSIKCHSGNDLVFFYIEHNNSQPANQTIKQNVLSGLYWAVVLDGLSSS